MKTSNKTVSKPFGDEQQLRDLIAKREPKLQALIRSTRKALRGRFPSANELVYEYANALVIAYAPTERGSDGLVAISVGADGLRLVFTHGATMPDPTNLLLGSGKETRFSWIESPKTLRLSEVEALFETALVRAKPPLPEIGRGKLIFKSASRPNHRKLKPRH